LREHHFSVFNAATLKGRGYNEEKAQLGGDSVEETRSLRVQSVSEDINYSYWWFSTIPRILRWSKRLAKSDSAPWLVCLRAISAKKRHTSVYNHLINIIKFNYKL